MYVLLRARTNYLFCNKILEAPYEEEVSLLLKIFRFMVLGYAVILMLQVPERRLMD